MIHTHRDGGVGKSGTTVPERSALVSLSSVGRSRANGRCSDGMSTPAARRDQDARSARRLGYVNTYSLRPMKQTPTGSQGRDPSQRAADQQNGATGHGHETMGQIITRTAANWRP